MDLLTKIIAILGFLSALSIIVPNACFADVRIAQTEKAKYLYRIKLANLILQKTASKYRPAKVIPAFPKDPTQDRSLLLLKTGQIDLMYLPPTEEIIKNYGVIKIDIHNGMLGYRVLIIRKEDQPRFSKVKSLEDLRKFTGGFGSQWNDFIIFALNRLPVVGAADTSSLLMMLSAGRFDYFHRGLHEAWVEVAAHKKELPNLKVEDTLALVYDYQVYFIVNKRNTRLKERFTKGFKIVLSDGSFKKLFQEAFGHLAQQADLSHRTIIKLKYNGPPGLPAVNTSLWK